MINIFINLLFLPIELLTEFLTRSSPRGKIYFWGASFIGFFAVGLFASEGIYKLTFWFVWAYGYLLSLLCLIASLKNSDSVNMSNLTSKSE